ncbi:MAG: NAD-dependent deacylase [Pseudomonadota bacterium]
MKIVILTGAGISAESGLGTFRDVDGLWTQYDLEDVATPEGFARNPALVLDFYNKRRANCLGAEPNAAHFALAELEAAHEVLIVTQNVDDLHERAGSQNLIHMHGELLGQLCAACGDRRPCAGDLTVESACPACGAAALRPDVVWFGEMPYQMDRIWDALRDTDLFVSIGTSGEVYPAAAFAQDARRFGAETLELNLEPSTGARDFIDARYGPATEIVPAWVAEMTARTPT